MDLIRVYQKARRGKDLSDSPTPTEYLISFERNKSIAIFKEKDNELIPCSKFVLGDQAEYDSFNLNYLGTITSITDKTVTITKQYGNNKPDIHRLSIYEFCWRNYNFDLEVIRAKNNETSMYI